MASDTDKDVRQWKKAGNLATQPEVLAALARDRDVGVRWRVAGNRWPNRLNSSAE